MLSRTNYDMIACNLALAVIAALMMAVVGGSLNVIRILEGLDVAGFNIDLGVGAVVNPGVFMASAVVFFSMTAALLFAVLDRIQHLWTVIRVMVSIGGWGATITSFVFFIATLVLVPLSLGVEVGI